MTLENIYQRLQDVLYQLENNNADHLNLNNNLLREVSPDPEDKEEGISPPEGIITSLYSVLYKLEKQSKYQRENLNRSYQLILQSTEVPSQIKGH